MKQIRWSILLAAIVLLAIVFSTAALAAVDYTTFRNLKVNGITSSLSVTTGAITGLDASLGITGLAGTGTGNGGAIVLTSGASGDGATGNGGALTLTGGAAASTNGSGGALTLTGGAATGTGTAGGVNIDSGAAAGGGIWSPVNIGASNASMVVLGAADCPVVVYNESTAAYPFSANDGIEITSAFYGRTWLVSGAYSPTLTLPANGAPIGVWIRFVNVGTDATAPTWAAATADTLIAPNDAAADSVTFGSGHRIGSAVKFISTGSFWVVINESTGCTMTVGT